MSYRVPMILMLLAAAGFIGAAPAAAQPFTYCGQLSDADCALMQAGRQSLDELRSMTVKHASISSRPLDQHDGLHSTFSIQGVIASLPVGTGFDLRNLGDMNADFLLTVDLSGTPDESSSMLANLPEHSAVHVRVVDGTVYIELDSLVPLLEGAALHGWARLDLETGMPTPQPTSARPASTAAHPVLEPIVTGMDVVQLTETFEPELAQQFVTVSRRGDTFATQVDFAAMYAHPVFQAVLREQLQERARILRMSAAITDDKLAFLAGEMAALFPEPVTLYAITVDPHTRTARAFQSWGMFDFSTMVQAAVSGTSIRQWSNSVMEVLVEFDDYNAVERVIAPEDARTMTLDMLSGWPLMRLLMPY